MRRTALRIAAWVTPALLAAAGPGRAPAQAPPPLEATPPPVPARSALPAQLPPDAPERNAPPLAIPSPALTDTSSPARPEYTAPPAIQSAPPPLAPISPLPTSADPPPVPSGPPAKTTPTPPTPTEPGPAPRTVAPNGVAPQRLLPPPGPIPVLAAPAHPLQDPAGKKATTPPPPNPADLNPWARVPVIQRTAPLGLFLVPPCGPGRYSFLDLLNGTGRACPPPYPYPPFALQPVSSFDLDYQFLDRGGNPLADLFAPLKRVHPHPDAMVSVGGQASMRFVDEGDARLTDTDNSYLLYRGRAWADAWYRDQFRVFAELIYADIAGNELPPLQSDVNRGDVLNLFLDAKVADLAGNPAYVRVGRQELLFGSQRLVSTRDWTNTRQTFQGARAFWRSDELDLDAFWTHPVDVRASDHDRALSDVTFCGVWVTYRPAKGQVMDLYYLDLKDDRDQPDRLLPAAVAPRGSSRVETLGARYAGNQGPFLFDVEVMCQKGRTVNRDLKACAFTTAAGWDFGDIPCRPQVWVGYDYASGTPDPTIGSKDKTFNQLFAFGHYYFGYLDLVGRQNIQDLYCQVAGHPDNWVTVIAQCHHFELAEPTDFLYNAAGRPTRRSPTGLAGRNVGNEIDFVVNFHLTPNCDLLFGYSKLFAGDFIRNTGPDVSPQLCYAMYNLRW